MIGFPGSVSSERRQYDEVKTNFSQFYNFIFHGLQIVITLLYPGEYEICSVIRDTAQKRHFLLDTTWNSKVKKHRRWKKETLGSFFKMSMFYLNLPGADLCTQSMYMAWYWNYNSLMERNKKYKADFASQVVTISWYMLTTVIYWSTGLHPHEIRLHFWKSDREIKSALRDGYLLGNTFIMWLL